MSEQKGAGQREAETPNEKEGWRVIRILDEYRVAVNAGRRHGLDLGDVLEIVGQGTEIIDPFTSTSLGLVRRPKATVQIIYVDDLFSVAQSTESYEIEEPASGFSAIQSVLGQSGSVKRRILVKLPVKKEEIAGGWQLETIKVGDYVRRKGG